MAGHGAAAPLRAEAGGPLRGSVEVLGDKSISHRALILGALAVGETRITGLLEGQDVLDTGELSIAQRMDIRMAATFAIHEAKAVADAVWEIAGANAIFQTGPFERRLRDIRTVMQQAQGRKAHLQDVGAYLLGLEPALMFA